MQGLNNVSTDISSNTEHQGEIKENLIGELDNTDIVTDKSFIRKRNKKADPSSWKRYKQKELGMKGKAYKGLSKRGTKYNFIAKRGEWVMNLKERYIREEKSFFNNFGETWNEMRVNVLLLVDILDAKEVSTCRRSRSMRYHLKKNLKGFPDAKACSFDTVGLSERTVYF